MCSSDLKFGNVVVNVGNIVIDVGNDDVGVNRQLGLIGND